MSESAVRPVLRFEMDEPEGIRDRLLRIANDGGGRALNIRASIELELPSDHHEVDQEVERLAQNDPELVPRLDAATEIELEVTPVTPSPYFIVHEGQMTYESTSFGIALMDRTTSTYPMRVRLTFPGIQAPAQFSVKVLVWCTSILGERIGADPLEWNAEVDWSTDSQFL